MQIKLNCALNFASRKLKIKNSLIRSIKERIATILEFHPSLKD